MCGAPSADSGGAHHLYVRHVEALGAANVGDHHDDLVAHRAARDGDDNHKLEPYYVSAYAYYKLEFLFRNNALPNYYKPARFHLQMALRHLIGGPDMPALTANQAGSYSNKIAEVLWSDAKATDAFKEAVQVIDVALAGQPLTRDVVKTQGFTDLVKTAAAAR